MRTPLFIEDPKRKPIVHGLFQMADTLGFPLSDSIVESRRPGYSPGIPSYVADAILAGWPPQRALKKVREAFSDLGDISPDYLEEGLTIVLQDPLRWSTKTAKGNKVP